MESSVFMQKLSLTVCAYNPRVEGKTEGDLGVCWPANRAKRVSFGLNERC